VTRPALLVRTLSRDCQSGRGERGALSGVPALAVLVCAILLSSTPAAAQSPDDAFLAAVTELPAASFVEKEAIVERIIATGHASTRPVLVALLEDRLVVRERDAQVFILKSTDPGAPFTVLDPISMQPTAAAKEEELARVGTNNRLRRFLKITVARFALSSSDAAVRLDAVKEMAHTLDESTIDLLKQRAPSETDTGVRYEIETALALSALDSSDAPTRLAAIATLGNRLRPEVRNRLATMLDAAPDGTFVEPDATVRRAAETTVHSIDRSRSFYSGIETLFFGLSLGSVLVLIAIGLAITFGVMGVINMAHGELMMLGAYTTYVVQQLMPHHMGLSIFVAIPAAFLVSAFAGVVLERTIIRFLYGRPLETLLATFGVSLVLQQLVRSVFSANNRSVETPPWLSGTLQINEALGITYNRLYIVIFTSIVFAILLAVLRRTRLGLDIRAVAQNRSMARAMGIRTEWVDAMTFGLGSGIAGVAGVALSQLTNVGPNLGQSYIIDSFMVVVFGGVGNLWGTLIGGMSLGIVNKLLEPYAGAVLGKILVLVALILFIQRRPRGLFPELGRAAEN
jgi:urea transport system permease protein